MNFKERRDARASFIDKKLPKLDLSLLATSAPLSPEAAAMPPPPPVNSGESVRLSLIPEADWELQVEQLAALFHWKFYHTRNSEGSEEGFPDLVLLRPPRGIVAELKKMGQDPTVGQWDWLAWFKGAGFEMYVWRPSDFDQVMKILR